MYTNICLESQLGQYNLANKCIMIEQKVPWVKMNKN